MQSFAYSSDYISVPGVETYQAEIEISRQGEETPAWKCEQASACLKSKPGSHSLQSAVQHFCSLK